MNRVRLSFGWPLVAMLLVAACHREEPEGLDTLPSRKISIADKFYDVEAISAERAVVVGYGGKILLTEDGGRSWQLVPSGVKQALYSVEFVDAERGWAAGQTGVILHTRDGGRTWERQQTEATVYLFGIAFVNDHEGWAVGDRATYLHTVDGGAKWKIGKLGSTQAAGMSEDEELLAADPVLYGVQFLDSETGWIVGELGNIYHTADGGRSWATQQESLLGDAFFEVMDLPSFFGIHMTDRMNGTAAALDGRIARTRDGGKTWKFEPIETDVPFVDPLFQTFQTPGGTRWVVGAAGQVARAEPSGSWKRAPLGMEILTWLRGLDFHDDQNGWIVGGYGLILHTTDGGKSWLPSIG